MTLKRIGAGKRMSNAVIHGNMIYLSGYVAEKTQGKSVKEQTADILAQIDETLKEAGTDNGEAVNAKMREIPINDFQLKDVKIRADGQVMRPWFAITIKSPEESKAPYDYYVVKAEIAAEDIWRPASESACPLLKAN